MPESVARGTVAPLTPCRRGGKVTKVASDCQPAEITLRPDNVEFKPIVLTEQSGEARVVAEFLEVLG